MSRFFVGPGSVREEAVIITRPEDIHHIVDVLRLALGDTIVAADIEGWEYTCEIEAISKVSVRAVITDIQKASKEPETRVTLFQGVAKGGKLDDTVRKTTEIGVSAIVPVFMKRTVVADKGNYSKKVKRFRTIAEEASKQSGRGVIPEISDAVSFDEMIDMLGKFDLVIFCYENEDGRTIKDALREADVKPSNIALVIGPEGGFSDDEAETLSRIAAEQVSLGKTILRTETAGIAALSMIMYEYEL